MLILTSVLLYSSLLQGKTLGLMYEVDEMWVLTTLSCVCPNVHVHAGVWCEWMHICTHVCGDERTVLSVLLSIAIHFFFFLDI